MALGDEVALVLESLPELVERVLLLDREVPDTAGEGLVVGIGNALRAGVRAGRGGAHDDGRVGKEVG